MGKENSMLKKKKLEAAKREKSQSDFFFNLGGGVLTFL